MLISAGQCADRTGCQAGTAIGRNHLQWAIHDHIMREDPVEMEFIGLVALSLTSFQSLLPWNDFEGLRDGAKVPERFLELGVVNSDGRIDGGRLQATLEGLRRERHAGRMMR